MMGFHTTNVTGSGSVVGSGNGSDNGYLIRNSSGSADFTTLSFNNKTFLSNTGSVVIWVGGKNAGNWSGFGMSNTCGSDSINNDSIRFQTGDSGYIHLATNGSSQSNTNTDLPFSDLNFFGLVVLQYFTLGIWT